MAHRAVKIEKNQSYARRIGLEAAGLYRHRKNPTYAPTSIFVILLFRKKFQLKLTA